MAKSLNYELYVKLLGSATGKVPLQMKEGIQLLHYENTLMQYTSIFHGRLNDNFRLIFFYYFDIFAQNIDCGYTLEPPH